MNPKLIAFLVVAMILAGAAAVLYFRKPVEEDLDEADSYIGHEYDRATQYAQAVTKDARAEAEKIEQLPGKFVDGLKEIRKKSGY